MKRTLILFLMAAAAASGQSPDDEKAAAAGYGAKFLPKIIPPPIADSTTDEALRKLQASAKFGGLRKEEDSDKPPTHDLAAESTFIQVGESFTLVPKGSVLFVPPKMTKMIVTKPHGPFVPWPEMLVANRGSMAKFDVTFEQATGKDAIDQAKLDFAKKAGCLVVAMARGGAITVIPKPDAKPEAAVAK